MKRLTYKTVGDAFREPHYCHGPGIKKDDLLQRLGKLEDAFGKIENILRDEANCPKAIREIESTMIEIGGTP